MKQHSKLHCFMRAARPWMILTLLIVVCYLTGYLHSTYNDNRAANKMRANYQKQLDAENDANKTLSATLNTVLPQFQAKLKETSDKTDELSRTIKLSNELAVNASHEAASAVENSNRNARYLRDAVSKLSIVQSTTSTAAAKTDAAAVKVENAANSIAKAIEAPAPIREQKREPFPWGGG